MALKRVQLYNYIFNMDNNNSFLDLKGVGDLAEKLVEAQKHDTSISYYKHLTSLQLLQSNREYKAYST